MFGVCVAVRVVRRVLFVVVCHVFLFFVVLRCCWSWLFVGASLKTWLVVYCV